MALTIQSFPNPYDPATPLANAYAYISYLNVDMMSDNGMLTLNIHPSVAAADGGAPPVAQLTVSLGQAIPGTPSAFPRLDQLLADPQFAQAFGVIQGKLESALLQFPALAGATEVGA